MNWYLETELRHGTEEWDVSRQGFLMMFSFEVDLIPLMKCFRRLRQTSLGYCRIL